MTTTELDKVAYLIGYYLNEDDEIINKLLDPKTDILKGYLTPFTKELNMNLLSIETSQGKRDMIKFYVFEFWELQGFFKQQDDILYNGSLCNYNSVQYHHETSDGKKRKLTKFENYVVNSFKLFDMIFNEIQLCCLKFEHNFFEICKELNFSTKLIYTGITIAFIESRKKPLKIDNSKVSPKNELSLKDYYYEVCINFSCSSFFEFLLTQNDLEELSRNLEEQLKKYARKCGEGYEKDKGDMWSAGYNSRERWLNHTIFICKDEYNKTKKEIFNETVKWCKNWNDKYLYLFNPYSPEEEAEIHSSLFTPLWQQLDKTPVQSILSVDESKAERIAKTLAPLRKAFDETTHIDEIINALIKYSDHATLPNKVTSRVVQMGNNEFYPPFKNLKKESGMTNNAIATILAYFICKPNGAEIAITTIEKNIKMKYHLKQ